jgi:hypothetical protein
MFVQLPNVMSLRVAAAIGAAVGIIIIGKVRP